MTEKYSRRTFLKRAFSYLFGSVASISIGYAYARYIEPRQVSIVKHSITHPLIPAGFNGTKIVQFSDIHLGHNYELSHLNKNINLINELQPDIVLFTGDLIDNPLIYPEAEKIIPLLSKITAPLGKFSIYGNHDHGGYGSDQYKMIMVKSGFRVLANDYHTVKSIDNSEISIAGIDDLLLGRPDYEKTLQNNPATVYTILMIHEPDTAETSAQYNVHLQLSGHSHGGQIQLPFLGPLITPPLATKYYEGFYEIGEEKLKLYVNRGLGTTRLPFRFLSKPEITEFTLKKDANASF